MNTIRTILLPIVILGSIPLSVKLENLLNTYPTNDPIHLLLYPATILIGFIVLSVSFKLAEKPIWKTLCSLFR